MDSQLAHERQLNERHELRGVVDEAIKAVQEAAHLALELRRFVFMRSQHEPTVESEFEQTESELEAVARSLNGLQSRLAVRLPPDAGLPESINDVKAG